MPIQVPVWHDPGPLHLIMRLFDEYFLSGRLRATVICNPPLFTWASTFVGQVLQLVSGRLLVFKKTRVTIWDTHFVQGSFSEFTISCACINNPSILLWSLWSRCHMKCFIIYGIKHQCKILGWWGKFHMADPKVTYTYLPPGGIIYHCDKCNLLFEGHMLF